MITDNYKVTKELEEKGWLYDDTGVYIPYTHKNEEYYDNRDVFLKIERRSSKSELHYTYVKLEEGLFYPMSYYKSKKLIKEPDEELKRALSSRGISCGLNGRDGRYIDFIDSFRDAINAANCLDILKQKEIEICKQNGLINLTANKKDNYNHNFMDMKQLIMTITGKIPLKFGDRYNIHINPLTNDENDLVKVYRHVLRCKRTKKQYDQTELLMELFGFDTVEKVEEKFQELLQ